MTLKTDNVHSSTSVWAKWVSRLFKLDRLAASSFDPGRNTRLPKVRISTVQNLDPRLVVPATRIQRDGKEANTVSLISCSCSPAGLPEKPQPSHPILP